MITYQEAATLAQKLKAASPKILGIELFGSTRTNGVGRDADFLILVDEALAKEWWEKERESIRVRWPNALYGTRWIIKKFIPFVYSATIHNRKKKRMKVALNMLSIDPATFTGSDFEMFLVPKEWRKKQEVNLEVMSHVTDLVQDTNTLGFLKRVAKDAVRVTH